MKTNSHTSARPDLLAYTLIEVVVATGLLGLMIVAFYGGIASGFSLVGLARENLRANQIVLERMETIRLYSWDQINSNGFIAPTFKEWFYPGGATNGGAGTAYFGTMEITDAPVDAVYSTNMKRIHVTLSWTNNKARRTHEMETFVSEYGMQNYIY